MTTEVRAQFEIVFSLVLLAILLCDYTGLLKSWGLMVVVVGAAFIGTLPVIYGAVRGLREGEWASMDMLASVALLFSLLGAEWTSAVFIALMLSGSRLLSALTESRARKSIQSLLALRPDTVKVERGARVEIIALAQVVQGDIVVVDNGDRIPVDGVVIKGEAAVDESSLTGESIPVDKEVGSLVFSSTLVASGGLRIKAEKVGQDTMLEKIIQLVESSRDNRSKIMTMGERFGKAYLICTIIFAGGLFYVTQDIHLVLAVVLVVCADDIAIAVPLAFLGAIGTAAKQGIIVKGSAHLEVLGRATTFIFDKTGTLTKGVVQVEGAYPVAGTSEEDFLKWAGLAARGSKHPLSRAIVKYADEHGAPELFPELSRSVGGKGVVATYQGEHVIVGKPSYIESEGIAIPSEVREKIDMFGDAGKSVSLVARNGAVLGTIGLHDELKDEAPRAIAALRELGAKRIVMLTGDNEHVAKNVSQHLGITEYYYGLLPEDKVARIIELKEEGEVIMAGDGINDAAALASATVGVAMGGIGHDATIESADIVLMADDLMKLVEAVRLARLAQSIAVGDFWIWGITNSFGLALVFGGVIGPAGAAAYNFISDFFPLGNSLRAWKFGQKP